MPRRHISTNAQGKKLRIKSVALKYGSKKKNTFIKLEDVGLTKGNV